MTTKHATEQINT